MIELHTTPDLPDDMRFKRLIIRTLNRVSESPIWKAYRAGIVGREVAEVVMKSMFFDAVNAQDKDTFGPEVRGMMLETFETVFNLCSI